ncbi:MAG TPA: serine/threonine protein kinase [Candidatus Binatia bacterium]|nr:serine/threonine protein kinase [Candidatus Binatia bacterium]
MSDEVVGRRLADRYRIDELIARGGMARVYRARDERLERDVAVKLLSAPYADDPDFTSRFLDEARAAASLSHPSLVHVYDSGSDDGAHFIVMELLDGHRTLRQVLDERGRLTRDEVLRVGRELLAGLRVVHAQGLVHCDVKSANVMIGPGPAKLIDFGIASEPHEGTEGDTSIGSLHFMSPEQLHGEALTPSSDLFSLGAVLYEALTGRPPYPGETPEEVSAAHAAGAVRPPSTMVDGVPGRLDEAVLQALRRDPASRFRSAEAMRVALDAAVSAVEADREEVTRVVPTSLPGTTDASGYVPPPAPVARPAPASPARGAPAREPRRRSSAAQRRAGSVWGLLGTLLVLGAAALVVVLVIVPLLQLGQGGGAGPGSPTTAPTSPSDSNVVVVPQVVGQPTADAIARAREVGLNWTVRCAQDPSQPEGIIDQEPPAGTEVARGSAFTMFSARISDCR